MSAPLARLDAAPASASFDEAVRLLRLAAVARTVGEPGDARIAPLLQGRLALLPRTVELAADTVLADVVHDLLTRGWTPVELHTFAANRLEARALSYLTDTLAATGRWDADVPWLGQLRELRARTWWTPDAPHLGQWAQRHGLRRPDAIATAVEVLALLCFLPRTDDRVVVAAPPPPPSPAVLSRSAVQLVRSLVRRLLGGLTQRPNGRIW